MAERRDTGRAVLIARIWHRITRSSKRIDAAVPRAFKKCLRAIMPIQKTQLLTLLLVSSAWGHSLGRFNQGQENVLQVRSIPISGEIHLSFYQKRDAPDDGKLDEAKTDEAPKKEGTSLSKTDQLLPDLDKFKEDLAKHRKDFDEFTERARKRVDETLAKIEQDHKKADTPAQPPTSSVDTKSTTPTEAPVDKKGGKTSAPQQEVGESPGWV
ncbi:hypothetical protein H4Q26_016833 [Puccinia striiformis f. sp. tritici PST-130]|nr:hypothetical protein H4Q26_016833 [Puccinia striiformis f. sp. tritici PST-130]